MALHLPYHLAILGVVEGSQQLAQARYIYYGAQNLMFNAFYACNGKHLDGADLASNLTKNIEYFKLNESARGTIALGLVYEQIYFLGNDTGVCSEAMLANETHVSSDLLDLPYDFLHFISRSVGAMFQAFDIGIPLEGRLSDGKVFSINVALESWVVVYIYFWSAVILLLVCYTITRLLSDDEHGRGIWRLVKHYAALSILSRAIMIVFAIIMLVIGTTNHMFIQYYVASAWILPSVVLMLWIICWSDRISAMWKARKARKYESVAASDHTIDGGRAMHENDTPSQGIRRPDTNAYGYPA